MQNPFLFVTSPVRRRSAAIVVAAMAGLMLQCSAPAQPEVGPAQNLVVDNFERDLDGWLAVQITSGRNLSADTGAHVAITHDAADVKEGHGALSYVYRLDAKNLHALALPRPLNLGQMNSVQFWIKTSEATAIVFGMHDGNNLNEQTYAVCNAGQWYHLAFNLDQLRPQDPATPAGARLSLDEIEALYFADLANILPDYLRPAGTQSDRVLWLDDLQFSPARLPQTTGIVHRDNGTAFLVDNFATSQIRWIPVELDMGQTPPRALAFASPVEIDPMSFHSGQSSLKVTYTRGAQRLLGLLRNLDGTDFARATGVSLWLKSQRAGEFVVTLEKKNGARYQCPIALDANNWTQFSHSLDDFAVAAGSQDDDGILEAHQIKDITVADVTGLDEAAQAPITETQNSFWLDDVEMPLQSQG